MSDINPPLPLPPPLSPQTITIALADALHVDDPSAVRPCLHGDVGTVPFGANLVLINYHLVHPPTSLLSHNTSDLEWRGSSNGTEHRSEKQDNKYSSQKQSKSRRRGHDSDDDIDNNIDKRRQIIDGRLKDHRALVQNLFANDAKQAQKMSSNSSVSSIGQLTSLQQAIYRQSRALMALSLVPIEADTTNTNEKNKTILNDCFYLSSAAT
jgi:hypothetical protein